MGTGNPNVQRSAPNYYHFNYCTLPAILLYDVYVTSASV